MKKRTVLNQTLILCSLFFFIFPTMSSSSEMGDLAVDIEIAATPLHEWMPSVTYNPIDNEFLVLWHTTGVREEGGERMYSMHAQRISPDGQLLEEEPFSIVESFGPERRILPNAAHNPFTNEYMVAFAMGQELTEWDPFITVIASDGRSIVGPLPVSEELTKANHVNIVFNSKKKQYLIVYNDNRNGDAVIFGVIVDEGGAIIKEDFEISNADGNQINPYSCYNSLSDTYLVNWEDFRHVSDWQQLSNIYGALLDAEGNFIAEDIPMCEDHGLPDEGDQRHNNIAYNPDKNEFLVSWTDMRPSLNNVGVVGRIINADETLAGEHLILTDPAEAQIFPHIVYVRPKESYFALWEDNRNDELNTYWRDATNLDIYAGWLNSSGDPIGSHLPLWIGDGMQRYSRLAYSPLMDRFLIVWRDEVEEEVLEEEGSGHIVESGGNIMGKMYGVPSFMTGRTVEQETGNPIQDALVVGIGPSFFSLLKTNSGGWFNIAENAQTTGTYFIMVFKLGYHINAEFVNYEGEHIQPTIEMRRWW
ncbi:MAG: hypothetical protein KAR43_05970 [Deltaproteobacteria bacterium]|nr:hypothetical protein [Deltaproteobacteria bacterium]